MSELNIRRFEGVDEAWLEFIVNCGKSVPHDFDRFFGLVTNDNVFATVNLYESGILDAPAAIAQLRTYKTHDQLSFHTVRSHWGFTVCGIIRGVDRDCRNLTKTLQQID